MVTFYLGCSFGFEGRLEEAGVPVRNVEQGRNVSMFRVGPGLFWTAAVLFSSELDQNLTGTVW